MIDEEFASEYRKALYKAQKEDDIIELTNVFQVCQKRLDERLSHYQSLINQVQIE